MAGTRVYGDGGPSIFHILVSVFNVTYLFDPHIEGRQLVIGSPLAQPIPCMCTMI